VALLLTPLLLARACDVISLTNSAVHRGDILDLRKNSREGKVEVLVTDLKQIDSRFCSSSIRLRCPELCYLDGW
jgi:hypothetical protein